MDKMQFSGKKEEVQDQILQHMYRYTDNVVIKSLITRNLMENSNKAEYEILSFSSSIDRSNYGYLISDTKGNSKGVFIPGNLQFIVAAQFALLSISELFYSISDEEQESIFKSFIKTSLDAIIQDCDSSDYLWQFIVVK